MMPNPTFPIDRTADRSVEFISGDDQKTARWRMVQGLTNLAEAERFYANLIEDFVAQGADSFEKSASHRDSMQFSLEGEGHRAYRIADQHAEKLAVGWIDDGYKKINSTYDIVAPIGFIPYPPPQVMDYVNPDDPIHAAAVLSNTPKLIRLCRSADGTVTIPDELGNCPPGSVPPDWPWPMEPGFPPAEPVGPPAEPPSIGVPPDQPDIGTSPGTVPPPPPGSCPPPVVNCNPPDIYITNQPPNVYVSPPSVTIEPQIDVTVEGCTGSPCQPCVPPGPTVPPAPSPDPSCEPAAKSLSLATARGWTVQPIEGETGSAAKWSQHYVIAGPTGISRRLLVTGEVGPTKAGRTLPGSTWNSFGLYTVPDGVRQTFAEWDPDPAEPPINPDECPEEPPSTETPGVEPYDPCLRDNSCPPECDPDLADCAGGEFPEPVPGGGGGGGAAPPPPPPTIPTRPPIGRLSDLSGPGGMMDGRDFCEWVQAVDQPPPGSPDFAWNIDEIWEKLGTDVTGRTAIPSWLSPLMTIISPTSYGIPLAAISIIKNASNATNNLLERFGLSNPIAASAHVAMETGRGWLELLTRTDLGYYASGLTYMAKYQNPMLIPSQSELNSQLLADEITQENWECMTRSNGNIPSHALKSVTSQRSRPIATQLLSAWKRGIITGEEFTRRMRENGFLQDKDVQILERLFEQIPSYPDIIRFMVRDTFNDRAVEVGKFDEGFVDNFKGKAREWAEAQGVTEEVAKSFWRAHWEFPSNTALYEMIRRLRPGRVDDTLKVEYQDALEVLKINDIAPGWQERLLAVSYNPLTRTDLKIGFMNDAIDEPELIERLQDTGLNESDSRFVVELFRREKTLRDTNPAAKILGWSRREIVSKYVEGTIDRDETQNLLMQFGMAADDIAAVISNADIKAEVKRREICSKAIRRRYFIAEIEDDEALQRLVEIGFSEEGSQRIVNRWICERLSRRKEISATKNQALYLRGIITREEYAIRLDRLGYSNRNAADLMVEADARIQEKVVKSIVDALRKQEQAIKANVRNAEQRLKDLEKKIKEREKELKKKQDQENKE